MKSFSVLIFILFFLFSSSGLAKTKIFITLLPLNQLDLQASQQVAKQLKSSFDQKKYTIELSLEPPLLKAGLSLGQAVKQAQEYQLHFQDSQAINLLHEALNRLDNEIPNLQSQSSLINAYLMLASCYKNLGQTSQMNEALNEAARLSPNYIPSELYFSPSLVATFEKKADLLWNQDNFGSLMIDSTPQEALVYVNGTFKGKTPLSLDRHPPGNHHIFLIQGNKTAYQKITLKKGVHSSLKLHLALSKQNQTQKLGLEAQDYKSQKKWFEQILTHHSQDKAIALGVVTKGTKQYLVFHPYGIKGAKSKSFKVENKAKFNEIIKTIALSIR